MAERRASGEEQRRTNERKLLEKAPLDRSALAPRSMAMDVAGGGRWRRIPYVLTNVLNSVVVVVTVRHAAIANIRALIRFRGLGIGGP